MKRTTTLLSLLFLMIFVPMRAQQVVITYAQQSGNNCPLPATLNFQVSGNAYGYLPGDSVDVFIDFGDGNTHTSTEPIWLNPPYPSTYWLYVQHNYALAGMYTVTYIVTGPNGAADTTTSYAMATSSCNSITGKVYKDMNGDCAYNSGDVPYANLGVWVLYNGAQVAYVATNANGDYSAPGLAGYTYDLTLNGTYSTPGIAYGCSTADTMSVALATTAVVDFVGMDVNLIQISEALDTLGPYYCPSPSPVTFSVSGSIDGYSSSDSVEVYINFGDSHDTTVTVPIWGSIYWDNYWTTITHTYTSPGSYNVMYVATASDGLADTLIVLNDVIVDDSCGNLVGKLYLDGNSNCVFDQGESVVAGYPVTALMSTGNYEIAFTDINGDYYFNAPLGTHTVSIPNANVYGYTPDCPATGSQNATISTGTTHADFSMDCNSTSFDLGANLSGWGFRPGQPAYLHAWYNNTSCAPVSGTVTITLDPLTNYVGMCDTTNLPVVSGNTLSWNFSNISITGYWYWWNSILSCIQLTTDSTAQIGDTVCFTIAITPTSGDLNPANNTMTVCYEVRNSWDPNMKQVSPEGVGPTGNVAPNTTFTYTIHFQNMGTAPAIDITVMDTLDVDLDITSLQILGSSHFMQPDVIGSDVLRFHYPNINLPDSASNEPASHGWVQYRIKAKSNLPNFTPIENTAHIYFDFNPAVVTNTTLNTIDYALGVYEGLLNGNSVHTFPNPADDHLQLHFAQSFEGNLQLVDALGRVVLSQQITSARATILDLQQLSNGLYTLVLNGDQGTITRKVLVSHR